MRLAERCAPPLAPPPPVAAAELAAALARHPGVATRRRLLATAYAANPDLAPWTVDRQNQLRLVESRLVEFAAAVRLRLFDEGSFHAYEAASGCWSPVGLAELQQSIADDLAAVAPAPWREAVTDRLTARLLAAVATRLEGRLGQPDAFASDPAAPRLHAANGIVDLNAAPPALATPTPAHRSRHRLPFAYDPAATAPRFAAFLASQLDADDRGLLQRWTGSVLLGANRAQRMLLIHGPGGTGKSVFATLVEGLLGPDYLAGLDTAFLDQPFEAAGFLGKLLLTAKDVTGDFLQSRGAARLKALTGGDRLDARLKHRNERVRLRGDYAVLLIANTRLRVRLDGDESAWRRRLLMVSFSRRPERRLPRFAQLLLAEEGPGILAWAVEGAVAHLAELAATGDFALTAAQQQRVDTLLLESSSLESFLDERVAAVRAAATVTTDELVAAYFDYCRQHQWSPLPVRLAENRLPDLILERYGLVKQQGIMRDGRNRRGYQGLALQP